jgi:hypothetical protein
MTALAHRQWSWTGRGTPRVGVSFSVPLLAVSCRSPDSRSVSSPVAELRQLGPDSVELSGVLSVSQSVSGAIVVGDRGHPGLLVIHENGSTTRLGRAGNGPGEFEALTRVQRCSDGTIIAYDFAQARLHFFDESRFIKQVQLPPTLVTGDLVGCSSGDSLIFTRLPDQVPGVGLHVVPITLFSYAPSAAKVTWLATLRGTEMYFSERFQAYYERPYGLQTLIAFGPQGVVFAENSRLQLFRVLSDGSTSPVYLLPHSPEKARSSFRARYLRDRLAEEPDSAARIVLRGVLNEVTWGESVPPLDRLLTSTTGELWVRRTPRGDEISAEWLVVDRLGQLNGTITLPRQFRVMFVDDSQILGVEELPSGEERLARADRRLR